jgi:hypothetical protein
MNKKIEKTGAENIYRTSRAIFDAEHNKLLNIIPVKYTFALLSFTIICAMLFLTFSYLTIKPTHKQTKASQ